MLRRELIIGIALLVLAGCARDEVISMNGLKSDKFGNRVFLYDNSKLVIAEPPGITQISAITDYRTDSGHCRISINLHGVDKIPLTVEPNQCVVIEGREVRVKTLPKGEVQRIINSEDFRGLWEIEDSKHSQGN